MVYRWFSFGVFIIAAVFSPITQALPVISVLEATYAKSLHLIKVSSVPIVDISIDIPLSVIHVPDEKAGALSLLAVMLKAGPHKYSEDIFLQKLAMLGAKWEVIASKDKVQVKIRSLSDLHILKDLLPLIAEALTYPAFSPSIFKREQSLLIQYLQNMELLPGYKVAQELSREFYQGHPYGMLATVTTLSSLTVKDLELYYNQYFNPHSMCMSIVGDVTDQEAQNIERSLLAPLVNVRDKSGSVASLPIPDVIHPTLSKPLTVKKIVMPSAQTHVVMGLPIFNIATASAKDYATAKVFNYIIGGGFLSRLFIAVRSERGLAYHISSRMDLFKMSGMWAVIFQTQNSQADEAIQVVHDVLQTVVKHGVTEAEVDRGKVALKATYQVMTGQSNASLINWLGDSNFYATNIWSEYDYIAALDSITLSDIQIFINRYIHLNKLLTISAGGVVVE